MASLDQIAAISLEPLGKIEIYALHLDGEQVAAGYCDISAPLEPVGVLWCEPAVSQSIEARLLPELDFTPGLDGEVVPFSMQVDSIAVFADGFLRSGAARSAVCVLDRRSGGWRVLERTDESTPIVVGFARGSSHLVQLRQLGTRVGIISITNSPSREAPFPGDLKPRTLAVNSELTHFAFSTDAGVFCSRIDGPLECTWPTTGPIRELWFAEDDLALVARRRDTLLLHQWGGRVQEFALPGLSPKSFDPTTRTALFCNSHSREYSELDLSSGRVRSSGVLPEFFRLDVDLRRRRIATYRPGLLQIFQMS